MKKRIFSGLLTLCVLLALAAPASADVLWEPDNRFYETHACTLLDRGFYANGPDGYVTLLDEPEGSAVQARFENGTALHVYWLYEEAWGCITAWSDNEEISGWVPMDQLSLIYDHVSFVEEYGEQFRDYDGEFAGYDGPAHGITFWEYPGAAQPNVVWKYEADILEELTGPYAFSEVFEDEQGHIWGFVGYLYGHRSFWICLDDPTGTDFPVRDIHQEELIPARSPDEPALPETLDDASGIQSAGPVARTAAAASVSWAPYVLVAAVVLVTAALIFWFYLRKKKN